MNPISCKSLFKSLEGQEVLKGLDLEISQGQIYGLLGRNGAGKSTLIKTLMGLFRPEGGKALVMGADLGDGLPTQKVDTGYVSEGQILPPWARIKDLMGFERGFRPRWDEGPLRRWMLQEHLDPSHRVGSLSKGQLKRLELELVLSAKPRVLLLDEPMSGLDPVSRAEFLESLMGFMEGGEITILLSSHILTDLERVCDRVGILAQGRIVQEDDMDAIKERGESLEQLGTELIRKFDPREALHA